MTCTSLHRHRGTLVYREPSYYERVAGETPTQTRTNRVAFLLLNDDPCTFEILYTSAQRTIEEAANYDCSDSFVSKVTFRLRDLLDLGIVLLLISHSIHFCTFGIF